MTVRVHAVAGSIALLLVAAFWSVTVVSELFWSPAAVAAVKRAVLYGIAFLIPALIIAGGSGFALSARRKGELVDVKKARMRLIALNGLLVLAPSAVFLSGKAAAGQFDAAFGTVQAIELAAGALQLILLGRNFRDGLRLAGRLRRGGAHAVA
jgi:hypothetical protein